MNKALDIRAGIAYYNEKMLAFVHCSIRSEYVEGATNEKVAYIEAIYVEEEYRNFGIATHLIELCEKCAKEQGITQIASDCEIDNLDSVKLHLSSGFEESAKLIHFIKNI
jgi:aminoglycoside 6'-N-acetyltransferase I